MENLNELLQELLEGGTQLKSSRPKKSYDGAFDLCSPQPRGRKNLGRPAKVWQLVLHHSAFGECPHRVFEGENPTDLIKTAIEFLKSLKNKEGNPGLTPEKNDPTKDQ